MTIVHGGGCMQHNWCGARDTQCTPCSVAALASGKSIHMSDTHLHGGYTLCCRGAGADTLQTHPAGTTEHVVLVECCPVERTHTTYGMGLRRPQASATPVAPPRASLQLHIPTTTNPLRTPAEEAAAKHAHDLGLHHVVPHMPK